MTIKIKVKCECGVVEHHAKMVDIKLGRLFGHNMMLVDVPEERAKHVEKLAKKHMEKLEELFYKDTFGAFDRDMEIVKALSGK